MRLSVIDTGYFKLDGGAMFGVIPKSMWERKTIPDENNLCTWAARCLLIETGDRKILVDTGMGTKQDEKFKSHFHPHGEENLIKSIDQTALGAHEITDVFLTHLHFDHVGGALYYDTEGKIKPTFPNAKYWTNEAHLEWALNPNPREKASFLSENIRPLQEMGLLHFITDQDNHPWMDKIKIRMAYGHTEAMMLPQIQYKDKTILYCADLMPSSYHIGLPWVISYDVRPLHTMKEKELILNEAIENDFILFFEHDPSVECATVKRNDRGRIVLDQTFDLSTIL